ncbi:MAG: hypothetical protein US49_C0006G0119 [candidate division TM6 bacterium GW2011_GWF2_37_49]|nr:MAG: hypothetical protein US49_C0006G0119 [candidate division TM6 bacterium GW2011_GWF2_37_49]
MKKVLFTTPILEHPPAGGPFLRIENSIKALNLISELHIISRVHRNFVGGANAELFYKKISYKFLYSPSARCDGFIKRVFKKFIKILKKGCSSKSDIESDAEFIIRYSKKNKINTIWFGYGNISFELMKRIKQLDPSLRLICDTDSVWSRYVLRELPFESNQKRKEEILFNGSLKEIEEESWTSFCDVTTAVSEVDAEYYRGLTKNKEKIKIFSNVIDVGNYSFTPAISATSFKKKYIYLAGSFGKNSPMDKAARWFISEVWPILKQQKEDLQFCIVGCNSDVVLSDIKDPDIQINGKVNSVLHYLVNADIAIVPLFFESGTRFKILEAGACGVPIVSTTLGAEGLAVKNEKHILLADDPTNFAKAILKLLDDEEYSIFIGKNCKCLVEENYSINKLIYEGQAILDYLANK